jgi:hypothetical protein
MPNILKNQVILSTNTILDITVNNYIIQHLTDL